MTICVGVASRNAVAIAADSLYIEIPSGRQRSVSKLRQRDGFVAALAGVGASGETDLFDILHEALGATTNLSELPANFLGQLPVETAKSALQSWYSLTGGTEPIESFISILAGGVISGIPTLLRSWTEIDHGPEGEPLLTMRMQLFEPTDVAAVTAIGTTTFVDPYTQPFLELDALRRALQRSECSIESTNALPADADRDQTQAWARDLVTMTVDQSGQLQRPPWWRHADGTAWPVVGGAVGVCCLPIVVPGPE